MSDKLSTPLQIRNTALTSRLYTVWDVNPDTLIIGLKVVLVTQILFCIATTLTKLSMLVLVYRIVVQGSKKFPKIIVCVMVLIAAEGVAFVSTVVFQCRYVMSPGIAHSTVVIR